MREGLLMAQLACLKTIMHVILLSRALYRCTQVLSADAR
jgi:hypothetical protein